MRIQRYCGHIFTILAFLVLGACSDNIEPGLYADTPTGVSLSAISVTAVTSTRAEVKVLYDYNGIPLTGCGVYLTSIGSDTATRYEGEVSENGQFFVTLTNLSPSTEYQVLGFVQFTVDRISRESKGESASFRTLARPSVGDINPPIIE